MGLFCKHIWQHVKTVPLRSFLRDDSHYLAVYPNWNDYRVDAYVYECLKCQKKKVKEVEVRVRHQG